MNEERQRHKFRASALVRNIQKCVYCGAERRKFQGKLYYDCESKTYCSRPVFIKIHVRRETDELGN
jgi:uncharacterized CHY-type Zn-finger protein